MSLSWYDIDRRRAIGKVKSQFRNASMTDIDKIIEAVFDAGIDFANDQDLQRVKYGMS